MYKPLDEIFLSGGSEKVEFSSIEAPRDGHEFKVELSLHLVATLPKVIEIALRCRV